MPPQPRLLIVMEAAGRIAAIEIDAVRDRLDVVLKPMQGLLSGARGYAGTTLLGNGQVLLVLDVKGDAALTIRRSDEGIVVLDGVCAVEIARYPPADAPGNAGPPRLTGHNVANSIRPSPRSL